MNNVTLIGRLTKDPELRYIPETQTPVASFILAVDRPFAKEKTADFIKITVFGKAAENCERYLTKGKLTGIEGRIQTDSYKNKNGEKAYSTGVVAERVEFLEWGEKKTHEKQTPGVPAGFQVIEEDDDVPF